MASCDDDFTLIGDENETQPHSSHHHHQHNHHHQTFDPHRFASKPTPIQSHQPPAPLPLPQPQPHTIGGSPKNTGGATVRENEDGDDEYSDSGAPRFLPFSTEDNGNVFHAGGEDSDPNKSRANSRDKRKELEEVSDGGTPLYYKKPKPAGGSGGGGSAANTSGTVEYRYEYRPDYRKDREEWSDTAIGSLLDAYTEKYTQLNRGNLRGRDWQEVASVVSDRGNKQKAGKSVEQCKNKVDNLKKRYKVERHRMQNSGVTVSHWPWFKKIEEIVSNSTKAVSDEDKSGCASGTVSVATANVLRQAKRYSVPTPNPVSVTNNTKAKSLTNPRWRRVVFKVSGAALAGSGSQNIDPKVAMMIAREVSVACRLGVEVAIVVGGRNFFCADAWVAATGMDRSAAYQIGMMATVMNSILLQSALEKQGVQTRVQTAVPVQEVCEPYNKRRAIRHLEKGRVVIFGGVGAGTGNPLFTTDTAAALRASELNADAVLKGTNVDGVYDSHLRSNSSVAFEHISYRELVNRGVICMDMMAMTFCEENGIPVVVFNLLEPGNISKALCGQQVGTLVDQVGRVG